MQPNSFYLYPTLVDVFLNLSSEWVNERYRNVYNKNLKVHRGGDNRIDLRLKNSDQKAISFTGYIPVFILSNKDSKQILKKDAVTVDAATGKSYVLLTEQDLWDLDPGYYTYSIVLESRIDSGSDYIVSERKVTYIDSQYGSKAILEILTSVQGDVVDSLEITKFSETRPSSVGEDESTFFTSSLIDADYETTNSQSSHTFVYYLNSYTGNVKLQGSLDESATPKIWNDLLDFDFVEENIYYHNVVGKYRWFRVVHTPTSGTLDKILYR